ncbi:MULTISPECIES: LLM class flavin-dependent oxidoreductase [unclassified Beijerinckia]|uniref:LLM class flavin-dependent oxidoreductase n=1 Tax=unclassified Beijerinckia TaxID=2638183 RepID=UPI001FCDBC68|nr:MULTISPECIES: LLM class flavin-dependent oxidoreductase [unclassified Beijerinckia]
MFLPVFSGGWIKSTTSPKLSGSYRDNLAITLSAEEMGFDFAMSAALWRGYGGESQSAKYSLESMMCMAGLAQATSRIKIWATAHMMMWPPTIVAKMIATLDQIAGGRIGLNVVTGSKPPLMRQMGLWQDLRHDERYDLADEWVRLVRRIWSEESVTHKGRFYQTEDCLIHPKPSVTPTIICAGMSDRGFRFTAQNCDVAFMSAQDNAKFYERALRAKEIAAEVGNPKLKTFGLFPLIIGATDREGQEKLDMYNAGVDRAAVLQMMEDLNDDKDVQHNVGSKVFIDQAKALSAVMSNTMAGSAETIARRLATTVQEAKLDGIMIILADYDADLTAFGRKVLPAMRQHGITTNVASAA